MSGWYEGGGVIHALFHFILSEVMSWKRISLLWKYCDVLGGSN
jgi:hypothetical protein